MKGAEPTYRKEILYIFELILLRLLGDTLDEPNENVAEALQQAMGSLREQLDRIEWEKFAQPVLATIAEMPKSELPAVARQWLVYNHSREKFLRNTKQWADRLMWL